MSSNDDGDLIDLGNDACVPRVVVHESTPEELEHLLDVCPPKLEQKLSLTRKQEQVQTIGDNGDILVTLGHDQVVPIRKRIDVVSSDTIKRVRDITRNLEPVIRRTCSVGINEERQNTVDDGSTSDKFEDETFETREINNAFNFLSEHDDNEDQIETCFGCHDEDVVDSVQTVPTSTESTEDEDLLNHYPRDCSTSTSNSRKSCSGNCSRGRGDDATNEQDALNSDPSLVTSMNSKKVCQDTFRRIRSLPLDCDLEAGSKSIVKRLRTEDDTFDCRGAKRARETLRRIHRKSWTEGTNLSAITSNDDDDDGEHHGFSRFDRSISLGGEHRCEASTSDGAYSRQSGHAKSGCSFATEEGRASSPEDSGCSEVDWSWLEEVECLRPTESLAPVAVDALVQATERGGSTSPTSENTRRRREYRAIDVPSSAAMSVPAAAKSLAVDGSRWSTSDPLTNCDDNDNEDAARCNATNEAADPETRSTTALNSWVRASMRRLRHLRLPEGTAERQRNESSTRRGAIVSAPNSLPDIALIAPDILAAQTNGTLAGTTLLRPSSAPVRNANIANALPPRRGGRQSRGTRQQGTRNREVSSRQSSVLSTTTGSDTSSGVSSFDGASTSVPSSTATSPQRNASRRACERQRGADRDEDRGEDEDEDGNPLGRWPHALSPALACLGCTLGLFNISRFSILSIQFGAPFIVQFLILSMVLGIPLLTLQVCLGQRLAAGSVDMWKISPLFQGVGIALLTAQAFIGVYSIVGVSWMFVYFRDSFITKQDRYRWAEPFLLYRDDRPPYNSSTLYKLHETVPDYFNGVVLQRHHLNEPNPGVITLKFQVAFNLAVVWMIVFVSLSKGLRSYGKVVYVFTLVPIFGTLILCTKVLGLTPPDSLHLLFPPTVWSEFFINGKSWVAASIEVFLTWGLFGAAAMQIAAHNKHKHLLQRDTSLVMVLTIVVLLLAAALANACVHILRHNGYVYVPSSFERISVYAFMRPVNQPAPSGYSSTPEKFMVHASFIIGERVTRPGADYSVESGYQALRFSTELVPATLALLGTDQVSPFWAVLFYFTLILFGIAQQLAIWHCVITGIMAINRKMLKLWETTITFFSCACAYILGLPMATELGIYVVYYLDYTIGGSWWIMILYLVQVGAVFAVRGRPHNGEAVVTELFPPTGGCLRHWAGPLLSFTWNVILPVILMVLSITIFKNDGFRELYSYRRTSRDYWSVWARQLGAAIQLIPILTIPAVAIIQTCRYLNNGPPDIFDRIQLLYRPSMDMGDPRDAQTQIGTDTTTSIHGNGIVPATTEVPFEDPPPKYTPPPSYTTATGARIAKMLRQSFRRSVRRIANVLGESSAPRQRPALQPPPPDYATVLVEMNQSRQTQDVAIHVTEPRMEHTAAPTGAVPARSNGRNDARDERHRPNTIDRTTRIGVAVDRSAIERAHSTLDRGRRPYTNNCSSSGSNLTAADVANILRSSIRRGTARTQQSLRRSFSRDEPPTAASVENLVEAAAPIGEESLVLPKDISLVPHDKQAEENSDVKKTADETDNSVSVI